MVLVRVLVLVLVRLYHWIMEFTQLFTIAEVKIKHLLVLAER